MKIKFGVNYLQLLKYKELLQVMEKLISDNGELFGAWIKSDYHIFMSDPKYVEVSTQSFLQHNDI